VRRYLAGVITTVGRRALPAWFLLWTLVRVQQLSWDGRTFDTTFFGRDFRIYRAGATALLNDGNPWVASDRWNGTDWHFAALPPAAQLFVPFAAIPDWLGLAIFLVLSIGAAALALRRLGLPAWWLLFPPMTEGILAANPQILLFGLLVVGGPVARALAVALKVYAVVPIISRREWRALAVTGMVLALSVVLGAGLWASYAGQLGDVTSRVTQESHGGVSATLLLNPSVYGPALPADGLLRLLPGLLLYGIIALIVLSAAMRDVRAAGWMAVPLLWPAAEYHLATLAIPAARRLSTWIIAIATPPTYLLGLVVLAYEISAGRAALPHEPPPVGLVAWLRSGATRANNRGQAPIA
jgi:hypothetical protein